MQEIENIYSEFTMTGLAQRLKISYPTLIKNFKANPTLKKMLENLEPRNPLKNSDLKIILKILGEPTVIEEEEI